MGNVHNSVGRTHSRWLCGLRRIVAAATLMALGTVGCAAAAAAASGVGSPAAGGGSGGVPRGVGAPAAGRAEGVAIGGVFGGVGVAAVGAATRPWSPPVRPLAIIRAYDPPERDWLPGHRGVDLRAHLGQQVHAAGAGRITFATELAGRGVVVVSHGAIRTTYEPVQARVRRGEEIAAGQLLGVVAAGSGHCGEGHCLHFGVRRGETYLDPRFLLKGFKAVLRPWGAGTPVHAGSP